MTKTYADYKKEIHELSAKHSREIAALESEAGRARESELVTAREKVAAIAADLGVSVADLMSTRKSGAKKASKPVEVKYRDPASGGTWTGRGREPKWIKGMDRKKFEVAK